MTNILATSTNTPLQRARNYVASLLHYTMRVADPKYDEYVYGDLNNRPLDWETAHENRMSGFGPATGREYSPPVGDFRSLKIGTRAFDRLTNAFVKITDTREISRQEAETILFWIGIRTGLAGTPLSHFRETISKELLSLMRQPEANFRESLRSCTAEIAEKADLAELHEEVVAQKQAFGEPIADPRADGKTVPPRFVAPGLATNGYRMGTTLYNTSMNHDKAAPAAVAASASKDELHAEQTASGAGGAKTEGAALREVFSTPEARAALNDLASANAASLDIHPLQSQFDPFPIWDTLPYYYPPDAPRTIVELSSDGSKNGVVKHELGPYRSRWLVKWDTSVDRPSPILDNNNLLHLVLKTRDKDYPTIYHRVNLQTEEDTAIPLPFAIKSGLKPSLSEDGVLFVLGENQTYCGKTQYPIYAIYPDGNFETGYLLEAPTGLEGGKGKTALIHTTKGTNYLASCQAKQ